MLLILLSLIAVIPVSNAASITVNDSCSLANAITATGGCAAGDGADTISISGDITLSSSLPSITSEMTIESNDSNVKRTISGNNARRVFFVTYPGNLTVNNLVLTNGRSYDRDPSRVETGDQGGAIAVGLARTPLTITNSIISNNTAAADGGGLYYFGISNTVTIKRSTISGNTAASEGGAIYTSGDAHIENTTIIGNRASRGGAFYTGLDGDLTLKHATVAAI